MSIYVLLVFVIVLIAAFYLVRHIPDATIQTVVKVVLTVGAVIWIIRNLDGLLHCCTVR